MPKLLQFNTTINCGSTGRLAEDLGQVAMKAGWESYIAYGRDSRPSQSHAIKIGNKLTVFTHVLKTRLFDRHCFGSYFATKKLIRKIDEIKPDVIQFQNIHGYYVNLEVLLSYIAEKNIPLIWSLHDCWSMTGHCSHFVSVGCEKWKTECYNCPLTKRYPNSWGIDASRRNYRDKKRLTNAVPSLTIVSGSEWLGNIAKESFNKNRDIRVIPDGIDTTIYSPKSNGKELRIKLGLEGKFVIMVSGTVWLDYKGIPDYERLRKKLPEDVAIMFVGLSDEDMKIVPKGIIGIKRTKTQEELAEYYSMADCVMSLSRMESFGLTPVEGFACGTPAIVYDSTSLPELITPETGFVAKLGDVDDVVEKVIKLKEFGKLKYTEACRKLAVEKYSREVCFGKYLELYNELLANK